MNPALDNAAAPGPGLPSGTNRTNQFVLEAAFLATSLNAISMRQKKGTIAQEVESGFESYERLLGRRASLRLSDEEDIAVRKILQQIRSRLNYLRAWRIHPTGKPQHRSE